MIPERVADPADPRLADYIGLTDPGRRGPTEESAGLFIAEGRIVVERLLGTSLRVRSVLLTEERFDAVAPTLVARRADVRILVVSRPIAEAVTGYDVHRGVLAAADRPTPPPVDALLEGARTVVVLEDLTDQVNIGAVFRNAAALGADAVLLSPACADPLYRRSVRVSMGAVLTLPFCRLSPWPSGLSAVGSVGFEVIGLTPDPGADDLDTLRSERLGRVALVLGSEGPGLSPAVRARCARFVRVEMVAGADSLNVATAAAVTLYAIARRRESAGVSRSSAGP